MNHKSFDSVARSERYFTATLLAHLLMCNGFHGLKALFDELQISPSDEASSNDFEVVSELDPLRDSSIGDPGLQKLFQEHGRVAVPDLFLRWGNQALVLEAKFFTEPSAEELASQIEEQKKAIALVKSKAGYDSCHFTYALLTVRPIKTNANRKLPCHPLLWPKVIDTLKAAFGDDAAPDVAYCLEKLECAVERAGQELPKQLSWRRIDDIRTLIAKLPTLLERDLVYVGYTGGSKALGQASLEELEQRDHYKITEGPRPNANWLRVDEIVDRYMELKLDSLKLTEDLSD